jgi:hypothetical protein
MQKIESIDYLIHVRGVNLVGVREIFNLLDQMTEEKREEVMSRSRVAPRTRGKKALHNGIGAPWTWILPKTFMRFFDLSRSPNSERRPYVWNRRNS